MSSRSELSELLLPSCLLPPRSSSSPAFLVSSPLVPPRLLPLPSSPSPCCSPIHSPSSSLLHSAPPSSPRPPSSWVTCRQRSAREEVRSPSSACGSNLCLRDEPGGGEGVPRGDRAARSAHGVLALAAPAR
eukprot:760679-Hanusia_phi.AAC.9